MNEPREALRVRVIGGTPEGRDRALVLIDRALIAAGYTARKPPRHLHLVPDKRESS
jgi:hypothetical protein